ncbi:MAG: hypothetical protein AAGE37_06185 [Pseudomonadota bacterium]
MRKQLKLLGCGTLLVLSIPLFIVTCTNYPTEDFKEHCAHNLSIIVHDKPGWGEFLRQVRMRDFELRKEYPQETERFPDYVNLGNKLHSHMDAGFTTENDFSLGQNYQPKYRNPYRNYKHVYLEGKKIATITDYDVKWRSIDHSGSRSCLTSYASLLKVPIMTAKQYERAMHSENDVQAPALNP